MKTLKALPVRWADAEKTQPILFRVMLNLGKIDGKAKRHPVYGKTAQEAIAKAERLTGDIEDGLDPQYENATIAQLLFKWLDWTRSRIEPRTYESYEHIVEAFFVPEIGAWRCRALTPERVDTLFSDLAERTNPTTGTPYAPSYLLKIRAVLRRALNIGKRWGYVRRNVAELSEPIKQRPKKKRRLSDAQVRALLQAVEGHHYELLYHVLAKLGCRVGEALGIRWDDLDLDDGLVCMTGSIQRERTQQPGNGPKTVLRRKDYTKTAEGDDRFIALPPSLVPLFERHHRQQIISKAAVTNRGGVWVEPDLVFTTSLGTKLEGKTVGNHFRRVRAQIGLPKKTRLYDLRHTNLSIVTRDTDAVTARDRAGHSDVRTTLQFYAETDLETQRAAAAAIDRRFHDERAAEDKRSHS